MKKTKNKRYIRVLALVLTAVLMLSLAACKPKDPSLETPSGSSAGSTASSGAAEATKPSESESTAPTEPVPTESQPDPTASTAPTEPEQTEPPVTTAPTQAPTQAPTTPPVTTAPAATTPAATEPPVTVHSHSYSATTTYSGGCMEPGVRTFTCSCGHSYQEEVAKVGHIFGDKVVISATCTDLGYWERTCSTCGYVWSEVDTEALGHSYSDFVVVTAPTETAQGWEERSCSRCGDVNRQAIPMIGEVRDTYIDPRIVLEYGFMYKYFFTEGDTLAVWNYATYDICLSIHIDDNENLIAVWYLQDGTKMEYTLEPRAGWSKAIAIQEDGSYKLSETPGIG